MSTATAVFGVAAALCAFAAMHIVPKIYKAWVFSKKTELKAELVRQLQEVKDEFTEENHGQHRANRLSYLHSERVRLENAIHKIDEQLVE